MATQDIEEANMLFQHEIIHNNVFDIVIYHVCSAK